MKKKLTTVAVAASMLGGVAIGSFAAPPMAALAADSSTTAAANATARTPGQWITDTLKGLVDKGTITQAQSDAIASSLQSAEPKGGGGPGGRHGMMDLSTAATTLGVSESDLRTALQTKSLADVAKEKGVDVQKLIDALVAAEKAEIEKQVTAGTTTRAQADQREEDLTRRVTDAVSSVRGPRGGGAPPAGAPDGDGDGPAGAPATTSTTVAGATA